MATIKSYSDLQQSKKLAEMLPIESADMMWKKELKYRICSNEHKISESDFIYYPTFKEEKIIMSNFDIPCWSLAALLDILPDDTNIIKDETDTENEKYMCVAKAKDDIISTFGNNPVDACVAMIEKLHGLGLL